MPKFTTTQAKALTVKKIHKIATDGTYQGHSFRIIDKAQEKSYEFSSTKFAEDNQVGTDSTKEELVNAALTHMKTVERETKEPVTVSEEVADVKGKTIDEVLNPPSE